LSARIDDAKQGVSQADVYQMIAYGRLYDCSNLILLYPWHSGIDADDEPQRYAVRGGSDTLSIVTVDVARSGREAGRQVAAALTALNIDN
jgi:5-methylcytosine-specific restriction enzyme subunit McrC